MSKWLQREVQRSKLSEPEEDPTNVPDFILAQQVAVLKRKLGTMEEITGEYS